MTKITVFFMGSVGTALANVLAENGHDVFMWGKNQDAVDELNTCHTTKKNLKYATLNVNTIATSHMTKAIQFADIYLLALPTKPMREVTTKINNNLTSK
ncbi:NAD(P)-binding domain-containing protein, partial [Staphylococcus aureus]|uniref:NAD(P)-binding domain-containing protein n=1 Tax=Staphylococcus aureus TaxID=1280 RepID=UPI00210A310C